MSAWPRAEWPRPSAALALPRLEQVEPELARRGDEAARRRLRRAEQRVRRWLEAQRRRQSAVEAVLDLASGGAGQRQRVHVAESLAGERAPELAEAERRAHEGALAELDAEAEARPVEQAADLAA